MLKKLFFALVVILAAICVSGAIFKPEKTEKVEIKYTVATGETKWDIVGGLMKQYGDKRDIREVLWETDKANGIKGQHIFPGQTLYITLETTKEATK